MTDVYELDCSVEEDRPFIDFEQPENARQDWGMINEMIDDRVAVERPISIVITVGSPDALDWDFYMLPGTLGVVSRRAREVLAPFANRHFDFIELRLNDAPYFILRGTCPLDCLNRSRSELLFFKSNPAKVMEIRRYSFNRSVITDPIMFWIPERTGRIFCTPSVRDAVLKNLRGARIRPVPE